MIAAAPEAPTRATAGRNLRTLRVAPHSHVRYYSSRPGSRAPATLKPRGPGPHTGRYGGRQVGSWQRRQPVRGRDNRPGAGAREISRASALGHIFIKTPLLDPGPGAPQRGPGVYQWQLRGTVRPGGGRLGGWGGPGLRQGVRQGPGGLIVGSPVQTSRLPTSVHVPRRSGQILVGPLRAPQQG
jgi:hypothetical protein